jgi:hypothetical protein
MLVLLIICQITNMDRKKLSATLKKWNNIFCQGMVCKNNLRRDIFIILLVIISSVALISSGRYHFDKKIQKEEAKIPPPLSEEQVAEDVKNIQETIDTSNWKLYSNKFYGFKVSYPENWKVPAIQKGIIKAQWETRYQFRKNTNDENSPYIGFDVIIYDVQKTKELKNTNEFPKIKSDELSNKPQCASIEGHVIDTGDYPAAEIYIPPTDDCYNSVMFFSFIKDRYIYNIVPVAKDGAEIGNDPRIAVNKYFPEFLSAVSTADLIDIERANPQPAKPKITAPMPLSYIVVNGQLVCAKKNDHPSKSNQHKGKHLDMECCLDPDEYPNPWCYYPPDKYGKYL